VRHVLRIFAYSKTLWSVDKFVMMITMISKNNNNTEIYKPKFHLARHVMHFACVELEELTARHARLDALDTSKVLCRVET